ncbi:MAG TPA: ATP-binding protein [Chloroflexota bacterium]|nr:ATP-binding protein [Chloroflexota bacterium]
MPDSGADPRDQEIARLRAELERTRAETEQLRGRLSESATAEQRLGQQAIELNRSNRDLEEFAYVASHDLQEPLRMVVSYLQLIERRYKGKLDSDADEFIAFAVDGAKRMQALINDLLAYSRVGHAAQNVTRVDTNAVVDQAIASLERAAQDAGAAVTRDDLPTVWGDASQLAHVFQNLIANAIKFRGEAPPTVHVSARAADDPSIVQLTVADNGIGLDPQYQDRIFKLFQRLHNRSAYTGTGIGLAVCKKIVEGHGGRIWVQSSPGQGATFCFTLPLPPT